MPLTPRQTQTALWSAVAVALVLLLLTLGPVLTPFVAAAILAYVLEPGVSWIARHRVPRFVGVLSVLVLILGALLVFLLILLPVVQKEFVLIRDRLPGLISNLTEWIVPWIKARFNIDLHLDMTTVRTWITDNFQGLGDDIAAKVFAYAKSGGGAALQIVGLIVLVPVLTFFLLMDWNRLLEQLGRLIPPRWRGQSFALLGEVDTLLGHYLRGQMQVIVVMSMFFSAGLAIAGFDLWLPVGVLSGLLMAIPFVGFAVGATFALIDGMLQLGPLRGLISVVIVYGLGQMLESYVITPRLVGERIGLPPVAVIFALLAFGSLFGFVGVLLALPLAAIFSVALRRIRDAYRNSEFYNRAA